MTTIAARSVHPALVGLPVAFEAVTVAALVGFAVGGDPVWFRLGLVASLGTVATAIIAAIPGAIDLIEALPAGSAARRHGLRHALLESVALGLYAIVAAWLWSAWRSATGRDHIDASGPLVLAALGLVATAVAGVLGWRMRARSGGAGGAPGSAARRPGGHDAHL